MNDIKMKHLAANRLGLTSEYYFSMKLAEIKQRIRDGQDIINLAIGSPDVLPDHRVVEWLENNARDKMANKYAPYSGQEDFVSSIRSFHKKEFDVELSPKEILPLMGSKEGVFYAHFALLNPRDEVIVPDPGYLAYTATATMLEAKVRTYEASYELTEQQVLDSISLKINERTKVIWFTQPHMPTGRVWSTAFQHDLLALCRTNQIVLISDMPYAQIVDKRIESLSSMTTQTDWYLELHSMSKNFNMAGWRLGWAIGNVDILKLMLKSKSNVDSGQYAPLQKTAAQVLLRSREIAVRTKEVYKARRAKAEQLLELIGAQVFDGQEGMFVWAKLNSDNSIATSEDLLNRHHIFIPPGDIFGHNGQGYLRVSLCSSIEAFDKAIYRINKQ